jgi:hypothetical protein
VRCWACSRTIGLTDEISELPIVDALVHRLCYERELRQPPPVNVTLSQYLAQRLKRAA